jgi:hypothetical protein
MGGNIIIANMRLTGNAIKKTTDYRDITIIQNSISYAYLVQQLNSLKPVITTQLY